MQTMKRCATQPAMCWCTMSVSSMISDSIHGRERGHSKVNGSQQWVHPSMHMLGTHGARCLVVLHKITIYVWMHPFHMLWIWFSMQTAGIPKPKRKGNDGISRVKPSGQGQKAVRSGRGKVCVHFRHVYCLTKYLGTPHWKKWTVNQYDWLS
jgi:hypothetical protein